MQLIAKVGTMLQLGSTYQHTKSTFLTIMQTLELQANIKIALFRTFVGTKTT